MKDNNELLNEAKANLKKAKAELEKFGNANVDDKTKKLLQKNCQDAQNNIKIISGMIEDEKKQQLDAAKALEQVRQAKAEGEKLAALEPQAEDKDSNDIALPEENKNQKFTIHFPSSDELRSAVNYSNASRTKIQMPASDTKSAEPAAKSAKLATKFPEAKPAKTKKPATKKMSTREAMREAARQAFIGSPKKAKKKATTKAKKTTKKADSESKDNSTMTREQYRKLHNQKK